MGSTTDLRFSLLLVAGILLCAATCDASLSTTDVVLRGLAGGDVVVNIVHVQPAAAAADVAYTTTAADDSAVGADSALQQQQTADTASASAGMHNPGGDLDAVVITSPAVQHGNAGSAEGGSQQHDLKPLALLS
jgi:hypothetical protein